MSLHVFGTTSTIVDSCLGQKVHILRINKVLMDDTDGKIDFTLTLILSSYFTNDQ